MKYTHLTADGTTIGEVLEWQGWGVRENIDCVE